MTVATLLNGSCFYSSYFRLAHVFKSLPNLQIFPEILQKSLKNEINWIQQFKEGICIRLNSPNMDNDAILLANSTKKVFDELFEKSFQDYIRNMIKNERVYSLEGDLSDDIYSSKSDIDWIEAFTKKLPELCDKNGINSASYQYDEVFNTLQNKYDENDMLIFIKDKFANMNDIKEKVFNYFIIGLNKKICVKLNSYATQIEIDIIKGFLNAKADLINNNAQNLNEIFIPFVTGHPVFSDSTNIRELDANVNELQFIFYYTGGTGIGGENHYEGMFSVQALKNRLENI